MSEIRKVTLIPAVPPLPSVIKQFRRVAAYARVSTSSEDQINSLEAQKDFYTNMIQRRPGWVFCGLFADEGISGLQKQKRAQFQLMMEKALAGEFDLIVTKSISRFARNTVDTLTCIRQLKAVGCEVYFEKEDLWTFDGKGEFMLTLLSSMAQEESRSISENVAWGHRKRFSDGKYAVPYKQFLGYDRGMVVNEDEAAVVRLIYRLIFEGKTPIRVCRMLEQSGIPSPGGNKRWAKTTVNSILRNEKYKGDALLQKTFTVDFLEKKKKVNEGELPKYYVSEGHESIIPPATFDLMQEVLQRREKLGKRYSGKHSLSSKVVCSKCGGLFGTGSAHGSDRYWSCNQQRQKRTSCGMPYIPAHIMVARCRTTIAKLLSKNRQKVVDLLARHLPAFKKSHLVKYIPDFIEKPEMYFLTHDVVEILIDTIVVMEDGSLQFHLLQSMDK